MLDIEILSLGWKFFAFFLPKTGQIRFVIRFVTPRRRRRIYINSQRDELCPFCHVCLSVCLTVYTRVLHMFFSLQKTVNLQDLPISGHYRIQLCYKLTDQNKNRKSSTQCVREPYKRMSEYFEDLETFPSEHVFS